MNGKFYRTASLFLKKKSIKLYNCFDNRLIIISNVFEHQNSISECFLNDHVTLKTGVMLKIDL